ncbi:hypothetical protein IRJ41_011962 [Triplophysa rosa]|uniref:Uncharacterized protein n=1 Tax=Triplophysa rosa TaxID=992332 RepID=A0A9W7TNW1_TRIRA|nr:hypothetical protein IRJ41_011962 [Triplophysa rosa]
MDSFGREDQLRAQRSASDTLPCGATREGLSGLTFERLKEKNDVMLYEAAAGKRILGVESRRVNWGKWSSISAPFLSCSHPLFAPSPGLQELWEFYVTVRALLSTLKHAGRSCNIHIQPGNNGGLVLNSQVYMV